MINHLTFMWCVGRFTCLSFLIFLVSFNGTIAIAQAQNNQNNDSQNEQVIDEFSPNPLESTEPDPLLPNPPTLGELLSQTQQEKLAPTLEQLNTDATQLLQQGNLVGAFNLWTRELRLQRYFGFLAEVSALQRVGLIAWDNGQRLYLQFIVERLNNILQEVKTQESVDVELLQTLGSAFKDVRSKESGIDVYQTLLNYARQQEDLLAQEQALNEIGQIYLNWLDYLPAATAYEELLQTQQQIQLLRNEGVLPPPPPPKSQNQTGNETINQPSEVESLQQLAFIYEQLQEPVKAIGAKEQLVGYYFSQQNLLPIPSLKLTIGSDFEKLGQLQQASLNYQEAYSLATSIQQFANASEALERLARLYRAQQQNKTALELYQAQLLINQQSYNFYGMMNSYDNMGQIYFEQKAYQRALSSFQKGLEVAQRLKYREDYFLEKIKMVNRQIY